MRTLMNGWGKIYLFYGVIFFSFGLIGFISKVDLWPLFSLKISHYLDNIRIYSDLPIWEQTEIPVFNPQSLKKAIFYLSRNEEEQLVGEIRSILSVYYQEIQFRQINQNQNMPVEIIKNGQVSHIDYYGVMSEVNFETGEVKRDFYFKLPQATEEQLVYYLSRAGYSNLIAEKLFNHQMTVYHLQWHTHPSMADRILSEILSEQIRLQPVSSVKI